jgi:hypothetical protein
MSPVHVAGPCRRNGTVTPGFLRSQATPDHFGGHLDRAVAAILERGGPRGEDERSLVLTRYRRLRLDPTRAEETARMAAAPGLRA